MYNVRSAVCARLSLWRSRHGGGGGFEAKSIQQNLEVAAWLVQHGALPDLVAEGRVDATALSVAAGNPRVTKWLHDAARDASRCASGNSEHNPPNDINGARLDLMYVSPASGAWPSTLSLHTNTCRAHTVDQLFFLVRAPHTRGQDQVP